MPFDSNLLPELSSGSTAPIEPEWLKILKARKIKGSLSDMMYEIGVKDIKAQTQLGDAVIKAMMDYQGGANLNIQHPLFGGNLGFNANRTNGNNSFRLQYQRSF